MPVAQEALDNAINIRTTYARNDDGSVRVYAEDRKEAGQPIYTGREVYFRSYAKTDEEAIAEVLNMLKAVFKRDINMKVATCVHDWELMPGVKSSIDCGHVGPDREVPANPFAKETK
jgi:hypothetical protein